MTHGSRPRIGVDVGGTNTDAVVMDGTALLAWAKTPTTPEVTGGIVASVAEALARASVSPDRVSAVMLGTTHFTNAVAQGDGRDLAPTAVVRLGLPATASVPPLADWPAGLRRQIDGHGYLAHGGYEFDGRPIAPLDPSELSEIARQIRASGARAVAVCAVFSPIRADLEEQAAALLRQALPEARFSLSSSIGRLGLLERENACVLNACLSELAERTVDGMQRALGELGITAPLYLSQNDGTLMSADFARAYPVLTFASGPTNSMRGAAALSGLRDAIVVDVGGTTADIGVLSGGFPRQASVAVQVAGVRTNFRMPDVLSIGLGGGSLVVAEDSKHVRIGPQSVGYRLVTEGRVFGGPQLTATDIAVAGGLVALGDAERVGDLDDLLVQRALATIADMVDTACDRMLLTPDPIPVLVVGGGSILVQDRIGRLAVTRPPYYQVANAVGAAIAQISGEIDRVYALAELPRERALADAKEQATGRAVAAGANPGSVRIVDVEEVPLAYLPSNATRIHVKAIGDLNID